MEKTTKKESVFSVLNAIDCSEHTEQKNGLTYLSWAFAWGIAKKHFPDATYTIYENASGWNYHTDGATAWVKTGVTIQGVEYIEYLPVMDFKNRSIPMGQITSFDVNKAIQRSLTKALARHGLGLYIYAGEDLPDMDFSILVAGAKTEDELKAVWDKFVKKYGQPKSTDDFCKAVVKKQEELKEAAEVNQERKEAVNE